MGPLRVECQSIMLTSSSLLIRPDAETASQRRVSRSSPSGIFSALAGRHYWNGARRCTNFGVQQHTEGHRGRMKGGSLHLETLVSLPWDTISNEKILEICSSNNGCFHLYVCRQGVQGWQEHDRGKAHDSNGGAGVSWQIQFISF